MQWYLIPIIVISAAIILANNLYHSFRNIPTTGFVVNNQFNITESHTSTTLANLNFVQTQKCPNSCDDFNPCTSDYCNERTNYSCVHEPIIGCCELGKVYCDGKCVIVRCIVDKDCDDGLSYTEDKCINPNSCNASCIHNLIPNICGNGVCESNENYSNCPKDCSFLAKEENISNSDEPKNNMNENNNTIENNTRCANHVVISEVYYYSNSTSSEFIELYNPTNYDIDISGWIISTKTYAIDAVLPENSIIKAGGIFLIADRNWDLNKDNSSWPSADYEETITLANSNGWVILKDKMNNTIDMVGWGNATIYEGLPTVNTKKMKSISRNPICQDTDNNYNDFIETIPTPGY